MEVDGLPCKEQKGGTCSITSIRIAYELSKGKFTEGQKKIWKALYPVIQKEKTHNGKNGFKALESLYIWYSRGLPPIDLKLLPLCNFTSAMDQLLVQGKKMIFSIHFFQYAKTFDTDTFEYDVCDDEESNQCEEKQEYDKVKRYSVDDETNPYLQIIPMAETRRKWTSGYNGPSGSKREEGKRVWPTHNISSTVTGHAICCVGKKGEYYVMHDSRITNFTCRKYIHQSYVTRRQCTLKEKTCTGLINAIYFVDTDHQGRGTPTAHTDQVLMPSMKPLKL